MFPSHDPVAVIEEFDYGLYPGKLLVSAHIFQRGKWVELKKDHKYNKKIEIYLEDINGFTSVG